LKLSELTAIEQKISPAARFVAFPLSLMVRRKAMSEIKLLKESGMLLLRKYTYTICMTNLSDRKDFAEITIFQVFGDLGQRIGQIFPILHKLLKR